jgi:DNA-binding NtrC family response regulator
LHVLEIAMPSLRERSSDLPVLAGNFLALAKRPLTFADETFAILQRHAWPGNLRELRNALEHAAAVCTGPVILPAHLPRGLREEAEVAPGRDQQLVAALQNWLDVQVDRKLTYDAIHDTLEGYALRHLLERFEGKPTVLARETNMNRVTLRKKLAAAGIRSTEAEG